MIGLVGRKLGMTQIPTKDGTMTPVTVIEAGPCYVLQGKTLEKDGYYAIKVGFGEIKSKKLNKPLLGEAKKVFGERDSYPLRVIKEFRLNEAPQYNPGDVLTVELFSEGEKVDVQGISIGKGYQGVMKRWGFSGGPRSHGSKFHRRPGSIGQHSEPAKVWKGKKMAGHTGFRKVTVKNLQVMHIDKERNLVFVKGAVPGSTGSIVYITKAKGYGNEH